MKGVDAHYWKDVMRGANVFYWIVDTKSPAWVQNCYILSMPPCTCRLLISRKENMFKIGEIWISFPILYFWNYKIVIYAVC